jgi:D-glycero-alpha-D-manno-heptose-7-phosphate kinase
MARAARAEKRTVVARAPTRIDLGGGWTDVPPYCDNEGGFVCNVAIDRYAVATLTEEDSSAASVPSAPARAITGDEPLISAALRRSGVTNARVSLTNDFPVGAGLGGSSAASAALLGALAAWRGDEWDRCAIAEEGRRIEVEELGVAGGRQDHYAATHGGALALTFSTAVDVKRVALTPSTRNALERQSLLIYTNESRISGDTITGVLNAYQNRDRVVLRSLHRMKQLAEEMKDSLELGDVDQLGTLVGEHWVHQRALHPAIPTSRIDQIVSRATAAGALGAKAMGASGGGCVLVIAPGDNVERVRQSIAPLGTLLPFRIDLDGLARADKPR